MSPRPRSQVRQDYIWNSVSSVMAAASTVIITLAVTRVSGVGLAGIVALGIRIGQQFQSLGMYEVRTYQATDVRQRFGFGTYHAVRIFTVLLMLVGIVLFPIFTNQPKEDLALIILVAALRLIDAFEDVFFGELQRKGRLDVAGKAYFFRVFTTTLVFCVALVLTQNVWTTTLITLVVSVVAMVLMVVLPSRAFFQIRPSFDLTPAVALLRDCLPLAISAFLGVYLANAPTFAIGANMDSAALGYFAIIFMPAYAVNLLSTLIFRPLLTRMAQIWVGKDAPAFNRIVVRGVQGALVAFVIVFAVTFLVGVPLLNWLSGSDVTPFKSEMLVLVTGGSFFAISVVLYYALSTIRKQRAVFISYAIASVVVFVTSALLVPRFEIMGASIAYTVSILVLCLLFGAFLVYYLRDPEATRASERGVAKN